MFTLAMQQQQRHHTALEHLPGPLDQELTESCLNTWLADQKVG
ncbi:hypothetical protein [Acinetobacter indicus]|nr:hypothetical protein [Acinetobacter indicus]